jgi:hypothetical protein
MQYAGRNARLTNTFYKKNFYKLMWHNMIGYEINLNFEKPNHVVSHQFVKLIIIIIIIIIIIL